MAVVLNSGHTVCGSCAAAMECGDTSFGAGMTMALPEGGSQRLHNTLKWAGNQVLRGVQNVGRAALFPAKIAYEVTRRDSIGGYSGGGGWGRQSALRTYGTGRMHAPYHDAGMSVGFPAGATTGAYGVPAGGWGQDAAFAVGGTAGPVEIAMKNMHQSHVNLALLSALLAEDTVSDVAKANIRSVYPRLEANARFISQFSVNDIDAAERQWQ